MPFMSLRPFILGLVVGVPLSVALVVLANSVDLGSAVTVGLYVAMIAVTVFTVVLSDARARGIPTRIDRHLPPPRRRRVRP